MAFPVGWGRKCELKIQASKVATTLSNFPVLLTVDNLPFEMYDADGAHPALNGGGDIRFSSDAAGTTRLACEVVTFVIDNNPANSLVEIWVSVASVSSSVDTSIWVWYNKSGENQPAEGASYGKHATWDDGGSDYFKMVQHLNDDPTSNGINAVDSTQYSNDGTSIGGMVSGDLVTGAFANGTRGKAWDLDGSNDYVDIGDVSNYPLTGSVEATIEMWVKADTILEDFCFFGNHNPSGERLYLAIREAKWDMGIDGNGWGSGHSGSLELATINWTSIIVTFGSSIATMYVNGSETINKPYTSIDIIGTLPIGAMNEYGTYQFHFSGLIDEVRISNIGRAVGWTSAGYNNQDDPASFVVEQTPQSPLEYKLEGVTYDKTGSVLGSCECYLFRHNLNDTLSYVDYVLSNAGTGAYSFTGIYDDTAQYIVVAWKDDTPHVFDTTDHVLEPVAV